jgi:hypothetical protein
MPVFLSSSTTDVLQFSASPLPRSLLRDQLAEMERSYIHKMPNPAVIAGKAAQIIAIPSPGRETFQGRNDGEKKNQAGVPARKRNRVDRGVLRGRKVKVARIKRLVTLYQFYTLQLILSICELHHRLASTRPDRQPLISKHRSFFSGTRFSHDYIALRLRQTNRGKHDA